ncbi:MAG: hypothetical protein H7A23_20220 [Leptospiraceae bacterium]|nr:hypothetical protein [Leptospiraceae bacterium]MCP5496885.1 hypothetical protein [Leptospiraceae bacterium]
MIRKVILILLIVFFNFSCRSIIILFSQQEQYTPYSGVVANYKCMSRYSDDEEQEENHLPSKFIKLSCAIDFPLTFVFDTVFLIVYPLILFRSCRAENE